MNWMSEDQIITSYTNNSVNIFNNIIRTEFWKEQGQLHLPMLQTGDKLRF